MSPENEEQTKILKEILKWIKIDGISKVKDILIKEMSDDKKILVYHYSDGKSSDEIEKLLNKKVTDMSIRNWWKGWAKLGLMELHPNYKKRYIKVFDLADFGIEIPDLTIVDSERAETNKNA
jgi:hypothetical protein